MMGVGSPGEIGDMLTLCDIPVLPRDDTGNIIMDWSKEGMVTCFTGPFEDSPENPSTVILDELGKEEIENRTLSLYKLKPSYQEISKKIPELWRIGYCQFALHLAPHSVKNKIYIEQRAFSGGYCDPDIVGFIPVGNRTPCDREDVELEYKMSCEDLARQINVTCSLDGEKYGGLRVEKSENQGRSIEGYTYFTSLHESQWNTILLKIPPFEEDCTKEIVANIGNPGEVADMLTLCEPPQCTPDDCSTEWNQSGGMVTAFTGSFEGNQENPGTVILEELKKEEENTLSCFKLGLSYEEVTQKIPELWKQQFWNFALHLTHHSVKNRIYLEQRAFSNGYCIPDINGFIPEGNKVSSNIQINELDCKKNCEELAKEVNEKCGLDGEEYGGLLVERSEDPGRSVEGYTYFISLQQSPWSTILVKVPQLEGDCTKEVVVNVIREVIRSAFK